MAFSMREPAMRPRRHGVSLEPEDRRELERAGWRTMMDYRENHLRSRDGRLIEVTAVAMVVASAKGATVEQAWAALRNDIECRRVKTLSRVRLLER